MITIMSNDEPIRGKWVWRDGQMVRKEKAKKLVVNAPYVHKDEVDAFENPVTGEMETSMSTYRRKLKEAGYFEKGNDRMQYEAPSFDERYEKNMEAAAEARRQIEWGMAPSTSEEREIWEQQKRQKQN
jgi:hypothetical protein